MGAEPVVSVLLPVFDAERTLPACLRSLRRQSLGDFEVVAVDDGSRDRSLSILEAAARGDPRIRILRRPHQGLVPTLNLALAAARGPLLARMDADDLAHPLRLERQVRRLREDPRTDILGCRVRLLADGLHGNAGMRSYVAWSNALLDHGSIVRDLLVESPLVHPSVMARTVAVRGLGGFRDYDGPEDYDLWLRAHAAGLRFCKLPERLLDWRDGPSRLTRCDPRYQADRFLRRKLEALEASALGRGRPVVVWGAGPIGKAWGRALVSRGHLLAAFVEVDPGKIGQRLLGAPVVAVPAAAGLGGALHLAAVGRKGARRRIRGAAAALGLVDGRDLLAVA